MPESVRQAIVALIVGAVMFGCVFVICGIIETTHPVEVSEQETTAMLYIDAETAQMITEADVVFETTTATQDASIVVDDSTTDSTTDLSTVASPIRVSEREIELIGRVIWGEAGGIADKTEQAAVAWCILNRVDNRGFNIETIITTPYQFFYTNGAGKAVPMQYIVLAADVVSRWEREHLGETDVGRVLPIEYEYFVGDGQHNHFSVEWRGTDFWDWSLPSPYEETGE